METINYALYSPELYGDDILFQWGLTDDLTEKMRGASGMFTIVNMRDGGKKPAILFKEFKAPLHDIVGTTIHEYTHYLQWKVGALNLVNPSGDQVKACEEQAHIQGWLASWEVIKTRPMGELKNWLYNRYLALPIYSTVCGFRSLKAMSQLSLKRYAKADAKTLFLAEKVSQYLNSADRSPYYGGAYQDEAAKHDELMQRALSADGFINPILQAFTEAAVEAPQAKAMDYLSQVVAIHNAS